MDLKLESSEPQQNLGNELIWRRNAPYYYQILYTAQLEWPSLTVQWLPNMDSNAKKQLNEELYTVNEILMGTNTSNQQQNYLIIGKVRIPDQQAIKKKCRENRMNKNETVLKNQSTAIQQKIQIMHKIPHQGEVNRVKHNPTVPNLIATRTPLGEIHVYDRFKLKKQNTKPEVILSGHDTEGYAIEWNPFQSGFIYAGSYDGKLSVWDVKHKTNDNKHSPLTHFKFHQNQIEDITHHKFHETVFASSDDGGYSAYWDTRYSKTPFYSMKNHAGVIYSIQFCPTNEFLVCTGGSEGLIKVWDVRNNTQPLFTMTQSQGEVSQLKWSTTERDFLWSVSGKRVSMWSVHQKKKKFVHGGHRGTVFQIDTCLSEADTIASVDENNQIQIFQPNQQCKL